MTADWAVIAISSDLISLEPREIVAIVGRSGCGKSSFFDLIIGLDEPTVVQSMASAPSARADEIIRSRATTALDALA